MIRQFPGQHLLESRGASDGNNAAYLWTLRQVIVTPEIPQRVTAVTNKPDPAEGLTIARDGNPRVRAFGTCSLQSLSDGNLPDSVLLPFPQRLRGRRVNVVILLSSGKQRGRYRAACISTSGHFLTGIYANRREPGFPKAPDR